MCTKPAWNSTPLLISFCLVERASVDYGFIVHEKIFQNRTSVCQHLAAQSILSLPTICWHEDATEGADANANDRIETKSPGNHCFSLRWRWTKSIVIIFISVAFLRDARYFIVFVRLSDSREKFPEIGSFICFACAHTRDSISVMYWHLNCSAVSSFTPFVWPLFCRLIQLPPVSVEL